MTFCPDDQTNPSLCVVVVRENFFRIRRDKKAFKVLGQNEKKKKKTDHTCDTFNNSSFCVSRGVWCFVFGGVCGGFLALASLSDDAKRIG